MSLANNNRPASAPRRRPIPAWMAKTCAAAGLGAGLLLGTSAQAALLGVSPVPPTVTCEGGPTLGVVSYNAASDLFTVDAIPTAANPGRAGIPSGPPAACELDVTVDASGNPGGGTLLIRDGNNNIVVTGTLVPGAFGFLNAGTTDRFDFIFTATGGDLVPVGDPVGVDLTSFNTGGGFNGTFASSFTGEAKPMLVGALPPGIDLEKHTGPVSDFDQSADADDPNDGTAPAIATNNTVHWTYKVTNTGGQTLSRIVVVDDHGTPALGDDLCTANGTCASPGTITCPDDELAPGEMMICTASDTALNLDNPPAGLTPVPGLCAGVPNRPLYENFAEATGETEDGAVVEDEDPSHYCNPPRPAIELEKHTGSVPGFDQGADADGPNDGDAPAIAAGNTVHWTYRVTNTGNVTLNNVTVVDDAGTPGNGADDLTSVQPGGAISCPQTTLVAGEIMFCTASLPAHDLDTPPTGLTPVPGTCEGIPNRPLYENMAVATGDPVTGPPPVQDDDPSHYCNPPGPDIDVEKATNGVDADNPNAGDAPQINPGDTVDWTYKVTNTGNVTLFDVAVVDDHGTPLDPADDLSTANGQIICPATTLAAGAMMTCTASDTAVDLDNPGGLTPVPGLCAGIPNRPLYENRAVATGATLTGETVDDEDPSHYCNPPGPDIDLEKHTGPVLGFENGFDADDRNDGQAPAIQPGDPVFWSFKVTNTGNVTLVNVVVVDDQGTPGVPGDDILPSCPQDTLAPGEMMVCTAMTIAADQAANPDHVLGVCLNQPNRPLYENMAVATGETVAGEEVMDDDPSHYCNPPPPQCDIRVTKTCEVVPPPTAPLTGKCSGQIQQWTLIWPANQPQITISGLPNDDADGVIEPGQEVTFFNPDTGNDVFLTIGGGLSGQSKFHLSCSDNDMNADNDNDVQPQVSPLGQDCGKLEGNAKGNEASFVNHWLLEGMVDADGLELDCTASAAFPSETAECVFTPAPQGSCDDIKDVTALTLVWDGPSGVDIVTEGGEAISNIQNGDVVMFSTVGLGNDVDLTLSGAVSGTSRFHVSCSDDAMDGPEDCGSFQGDGKDDKSDRNNQWLLGGMTGENGSFGCPGIPGGPDSAEVRYGFLVENLGADPVAVVITDNDLMLDNTDLGLPDPVTIAGNDTLQVTAGPFVITPDASDVFTNTVTVVGNGGECEAMDSVSVRREPPPPPPVSCSDIKDITAVSLVWNGPGPIDVVMESGETFSGVQTGNRITFQEAGTGNDVLMSITGAVNGTSEFHVSCSDDAMNGSEDCGTAQGNGKDDDGSLDNQWLLDGMTGENGSFDCGLPNTGEVAGVAPPDVTAAAALDLGDDKKVKWEFTNSGNTDVFIERVFITWPAGHEELKKMKFDGDFVKDVKDTASPTDVPADKAFESDDKKRKLKKGETRKLEIEFAKDVKNRTGAEFTIQVEFSNGQVLSFP